MIAVKFLFCLGSKEQKEERVNRCQDSQERSERDPEFLSKIITGDETWVYGYDPETKQQSSQENSSPPRPKKARQVRSNVNSTLVVFLSTLTELCNMNFFHKDKL
jgi:hypothetical protein